MMSYFIYQFLSDLDPSRWRVSLEYYTVRSIIFLVIFEFKEIETRLQKL